MGLWSFSAQKDRLMASPRNHFPLGHHTNHFLLTLRGTAELAKAKAIAPYSGFKVGAVAAGLDRGAWVMAQGANIEVGVSAAGVCAERVAISALLMQGIQPMLVCITADKPDVVPCGTCLQFMNEWKPMICTPEHYAPIAEFLPRPYQGRRPKL